jgi:hypothetical protein
MWFLHDGFWDPIILTIKLYRIVVHFLKGLYELVALLPRSPMAHRRLRVGFGMGWSPDEYSDR